jgi:hypothetical protein
MHSVRERGSGGEPSARKNESRIKELMGREDAGTRDKQAAVHRTSA